MVTSAVGLIEVEGYSVALAAVNMMEKTVPIRVLAIDCNNPKDEKNAEIPMTVQVIFKGVLSEVEEALVIGYKTALNHNTTAVVSSEIITRYADGLLPILESGKVNPQFSYEEFELYRAQKNIKLPTAIGIVEVQHYTNALLLLNDLLQEFDIKYEHHEGELGGRLITLIFSGSSSQVINACKFISLKKLRYHQKVYTSIPINYPTNELLRYVLKRK